MTISFDVVVLKNTFFVVTAPDSVPGCVWLCQDFCVSDFHLLLLFLFVLFDLFLFLICFVLFVFFSFVCYRIIIWLITFRVCMSVVVCRVACVWLCRVIYICLFTFFNFISIFCFVLFVFVCLLSVRDWVLCLCAWLRLFFSSVFFLNAVFVFCFAWVLCLVAPVFFCLFFF